jgi:hypothetical protein
VNIDPQILVGAQWTVFLGAVLLAAWLVCYFFWATWQLGVQWYTYLERVRTLERSKVQLDIDHHEKVRKLELKSLEAAHEREIARAKANDDAMNAALVGTSAPVPIQTIG